MSQKDAIRQIRDLGLTVSVRDGEFRINHRGGTEATAHFTDDAADAVGTAKDIAARLNPAR